MSEQEKTVSKEHEQDLVGLYESKYFKALTALVEEELETTKTYMLNKALPCDDLRFYQGRAEGLGVVLLRIKTIHEEAMKKPNE